MRGDFFVFRVRRGTSQRKPALLRLAAVRAAVGRAALGACGTLLGGLSVAVFAVGLVGHIVFHLLLLLVCADRRAFIPKGVSLASATPYSPSEEFLSEKVNNKSNGKHAIDMKNKNDGNPIDKMIQANKDEADSMLSLWGMKKRKKIKTKKVGR